MVEERERGGGEDKERDVCRDEREGWIGEDTEKYI